MSKTIPLLLDLTMSTELLEATTLEEDCLTSSLLLDLASEEEDGFTEELDSFAFSSDELEFFESLEDEDWRSPLEEGMTEDEDSSAGSGETDEEESSPQPAKINNAANTDKAKIFFIKPPNFNFFAKYNKPKEKGGLLTA